MNVTSSTQTQYTQATNKSKEKPEDYYDPLKGENYVLDTLDDEGNKLLNEALTDKTDEEKWFIKLQLDLSLSHEIKDGTLKRRTEIDNSKSSAINNLEAFVKMQRDLGNPDMNGAIAVAEKFLEAYKASGSSFNVQNKEDSVADEFLDDLYTNTSTATTTASSITKETIQNKVNEYAQTLMDSRGDTPESKLEVSKLLNDYKKELLQDYQDSLDGAKNDKMTLQQEAIIKVLLDENTKEASSLEKLLATKIDTEQKTNKSLNIDDYKIPNLDDKANAILNDLLVGQSESEKTNAKMWLSFLLMPDNIAHFDSDDDTTNHTLVRGDSLNSKLENLVDILKKSPGGSPEFLSLMTELSERYKG